MLFLVAGSSAFAQDNKTYSQYMFNGLLINPAYAGANKALNTTLIGRKQWAGFEDSPRTLSFTAHTPLRNQKVNVGFSYIADIYAINSQNNINAIYTYRLPFKNGSLSMGLQAGLDIRNYQPSQIKTTDPNDVVFTGLKPKERLPYFGTGLYFETEYYYLGISTPALLSISQDNIFEKNIVLISSGALLSLGENYKLKPSFLFKKAPSYNPQIDLNLNAYYKSFGLGVSYRAKDAVIFMAQYAVNNQFNLGYAYDLSIGALKSFNQGSHEIMLRYIFLYDLNVQSSRYF